MPEKFRADLVNVRILEDVEATGMFAFTLKCWDTVEMKVKWIDDELFREGKMVVVHMGYRDQVTKLFNGEISGLEPEFHTSEAPLLTVRGFDRRHRLMKQKKTKSYLKMKDSDIARQIAGEFGTEPEGRRHAGSLSTMSFSTTRPISSSSSSAPSGSATRSSRRIRSFTSGLARSPEAKH